jgi:iron complex outermembrane receptor protein
MSKTISDSTFALSLGLLMATVPQGFALAATDAATSNSGNSDGLQEIVVTAERRTETVQKSSLAISVLSADVLTHAGVAQAQDLNTVVPGLQLGMAGQTAQPYIRGVGNADNTGFAVSGVAFNVDGVYVAQPVSYGSSLYDVQRVEVLKGPQGTLYGRNATGGAINIITNGPTDTFGGYVGVEFGNYDLKRVNGALNLPISDKLSIRGAFQVTDRGGYFEDGSSDDKSQQGRIRVKLQATDDLTFRLNLEGDHFKDNGVGAAPDVGTSYFVPNPWGGPLSSGNKPYVLSTDTTTPPHLDQRDYSVSGEMDWNLGNFTVTVLPAYRDVNISALNYAQGFQLNTDPNTYRETTLEARLAYDSDSLKWLGGVYYFNEHQTVNLGVNFTPLELTVAVPDLHTGSVAGFTQGTYSVTDSFRVIAGVRYSSEQQSGYGVDTYTSPFVGPLPYNADVRSHSTDWKAGLEYDLAPDHMLYATASSGYKAGGWFPSPAGPLGTNTYLPEHLKAYDLGLRNQFFQRSLQINLEGFYWDYTDKQETFLGLDGIGVLDNVTRNAGAAKIKGGDIDVVWLATRADKFNAQAEYLDARYSQFTYFTPAPSSGCPTTPTATTGIYQINCSGEQMTRSPRWSGSYGYDHTVDLGGVGSLDLAANATFGSARWLAANYNLNMHAPSYMEGNLFATYTTADKHWSVTTYVRNFSNAVVATNAYASLLPNVSFVSLNPPRTFGAQVKYEF